MNQTDSVYSPDHILQQLFSVVFLLHPHPKKLKENILNLLPIVWYTTPFDEYKNHLARASRAYRHMIVR